MANEQLKSTEITNPDLPPIEQTPLPPKAPRNTKKILIIAAILLLAAGSGAFAFYKLSNKASAPTPTESSASTTDKETTETASTIDVTKLPLGDKKYSTEPKKGYVYSCQTSFNGGGAFKQGPWIDTANNTWNLNAKISVSGDVAWPNPQWSVNTSNQTRTLSGNGLPKHNTGIFPIPTTDTAYQYDRNPNSIKVNTLSLSLPVNPAIQTKPECVGGEVGVMLSGIPIFNAFDAGGRDAVATEIQDKCDGHPQASGQYHYHGHSDCLEDSTDKTKHSNLLGYAFDGFGIFGLRGEKGKELSSNDLDECHGHSHKITWDGKEVEMYHYHLTQDFPYSVSCFKAKKAVTQPLSAGEGGMQGMPPPRR